MHRQGHVGIVLLALAPISYILLTNGQPLLAVLAWGVLVIEPLPDNDQWLPYLTHRGISHSLVTAGVVGALCAGLGWVIGTYITVPGANWLITTILIDPAVIAWVDTHLAMLDADSLSLVGLCVGSGGIVLHLLGDVITVAGIRPFLPFSQRQVSLSSLRAKNALANRGLFVFGVLAIVASAIFSTPIGEALTRAFGDVWQAVFD
jgi:inner membrane protein